MINNAFFDAETRAQVLFVIDTGKMDYDCFEDFTEQIDDFKVSCADQYAGINDQNGREVYEGDIVIQDYTAVLENHIDPVTLGFIDQESWDGHHIGEVVLTANKGACMKNPIHHSIDEDTTEITNQYKTIAAYRSRVIGNVYENSELLEVQDDTDPESGPGDHEEKRATEATL